MLVLVVGAAAALLLSAPALSASPPLSAELPALASGGIQHSPAIAVNPGDPGHAVVTADDGNAAALPSAPFPSTTSAVSADWTAPAWTAGGVIHYSGSTSAGQADVAWGSGQNVYVVELGSNNSNPHSLCSTNAGILFSPSPDGGASFPDTALPIDVGSSTTELVEPAIAVDGNRIYIAYTELKWPTSGCGGTPDSSTILLIYSNDGGASWQSSRRVSPLAPSGHYRSPALAPLPDGRVIVAFRDDSSTTPQIETETCVSPSPPTGSYCGVSSGLVGPSTVIGDATSPSLVSGLAAAPTPSVIAAGGRVTVAWHASTGAAVRAFAAMSTDNGATFGPPQQIDPQGAGNQLAPALAATAGGRVDVAYLWDPSGGGIVSATTASAGGIL